MTVEEKAPLGNSAIDMATLANFKDKFVFISGGIPAGAMYCVNNKVNMYDIKLNFWSKCPNRVYAGANHSMLCVGRWLYILFGSHGGLCGVNVPHNYMERLDA